MALDSCRAALLACRSLAPSDAAATLRQAVPVYPLTTVLREPAIVLALGASRAAELRALLAPHAPRSCLLRASRVLGQAPGAPCALVHCPGGCRDMGLDADAVDGKRDDDVDDDDADDDVDDDDADDDVDDDDDAHRPSELLLLFNTLTQDWMSKPEYASRLIAACAANPDDAIARLCAAAILPHAPVLALVSVLECVPTLVLHAKHRDVWARCLVQPAADAAPSLSSWLHVLPLPPSFLSVHVAAPRLSHSLDPHALCWLQTQLRRGAALPAAAARALRRHLCPPRAPSICRDAAALQRAVDLLHAAAPAATTAAVSVPSLAHHSMPRAAAATPACVFDHASAVPRACDAACADVSQASSELSDVLAAAAVSDDLAGRAVAQIRQHLPLPQLQRCDGDAHDPWHCLTALRLAFAHAVVRAVPMLAASEVHRLVASVIAPLCSSGHVAPRVFDPADSFQCQEPRQRTLQYALLALLDLLLLLPLPPPARVRAALAQTARSAAPLHIAVYAPMLQLYLPTRDTALLSLLLDQRTVVCQSVDPAAWRAVITAAFPQPTDARLFLDEAA